ncbi:Conserved_hypothetical protein [Hexamita inflata]|uniref:Uncharacterized protein n=1 Tax=Hexamita inflata TaxID=28002 RepID=A0AA86RBX9_9EUKA|nr:Conserved hypothetical protein [Hexamita inflata]CAI9973402.1 Conserved hypothetical protein [Hexamita inflata]
MTAADASDPQIACIELIETCKQTISDTVTDKFEKSLSIYEAKILKAFEQLEDSVKARPLYVMFEHELNCDPITDHQHPKNVYPLFREQFTQIERSALQEITDFVVQQKNKMIELIIPQLDQIQAQIGLSIESITYKEAQFYSINKYQQQLTENNWKQMEEQRKAFARYKQGSNQVDESISSSMEKLQEEIILQKYSFTQLSQIMSERAKSVHNLEDKIKQQQQLIQLLNNEILTYKTQQQSLLQQKDELNQQILLQVEMHKNEVNHLLNDKVFTNVHEVQTEQMITEVKSIQYEWETNEAETQTIINPVKLVVSPKQSVQMKSGHMQTEEEFKDLFKIQFKESNLKNERHENAEQVEPLESYEFGLNNNSNVKSTTQLDCQVEEYSINAQANDNINQSVIQMDQISTDFTQKDNSQQLHVQKLQNNSNNHSFQSNHLQTEQYNNDQFESNQKYEDQTKQYIQQQQYNMPDIEIIKQQEENSSELQCQIIQTKNNNSKLNSNRNSQSQLLKGKLPNGGNSSQSLNSSHKSKVNNSSHQLNNSKQTDIEAESAPVHNSNQSNKSIISNKNSQQRISKIANGSNVELDQPSYHSKQFNTPILQRSIVNMNDNSIYSYNSNVHDISNDDISQIVVDALELEIQEIQQQFEFEKKMDNLSRKHKEVVKQMMTRDVGVQVDTQATSIEITDFTKLQLQNSSNSNSVKFKSSNNMLSRPIQQSYVETEESQSVKRQFKAKPIQFQQIQLADGSQDPHLCPSFSVLGDKLNESIEFTEQQLIKQHRDNIYFNASPKSLLRENSFSTVQNEWDSKGLSVTEIEQQISETQQQHSNIIQTIQDKKTQQLNLFSKENGGYGQTNRLDELCVIKLLTRGRSRVVQSQLDPLIPEQVQKNSLSGYKHLKLPQLQRLARNNEVKKSQLNGSKRK